MLAQPLSRVSLVLRTPLILRMRLTPILRPRWSSAEGRQNGSHRYTPRD